MESSATGLVRKSYSIHSKKDMIYRSIYIYSSKKEIIAVELNVFNTSL